MELQYKVIKHMEDKLSHYKMLYSLTKHSKQKEKHLFSIRWQEEIIEDYKKDYGIA